jgi:hypothetical protein
VTIEERFERIEHITAGLAEEHRRDHEENRQLWRNTQRQIDQLTADTNAAITRLGTEMREADRRLGERIDQLAERSEQADRRLGERIESLVSAMGQFLAKQK